MSLSENEIETEQKLMRKLKDYMLRTLSYYQSEGGVYNDIITVLLKLRKLPGYQMMPVPVRILNESVFYWDLLREGKGYGDWTLTDEIDRNPLILSVLACLSAATLDEGWLFTQELKAVLTGDSHYYPHFTPVVEKYEKEYEEANAKQYGEDLEEVVKHQGDVIKALEDKLADKEDTIQKQDATLAEQSALIDSLMTEKKVLDLELQKAKDGRHEKISDFDRYLSLETILDWVRDRQHYTYTEHVFRMLADMKDNRATDEEREKIRNLESEMLSKNVSNPIINTNYAIGSNLMTGVAQNPLMPIGVTPDEIIKQYLEFSKRYNDGQGQNKGV